MGEARCRRPLRASTRIARALFRHSTWSVGLVEQPIHAVAQSGTVDARDVQWLDLGDAPVAADPFPLRVGGVDYVLYERLVYGARPHKAIHWAELDEARRVVARGEAAGLPEHASYPYLLTVGNRVYCLPEAHRERRIALYEATDFPSRWRLAQVLVPDVPGLDPTLIRHEDRWWLFFTDSRLGGDSELHLWFAAELMGPWTAHPSNPVKRDSRSARPAGTPFVVDGVLYRPAQDCSEEYGRRVVINRVAILSPDRFVEVPVQAVEPAGGGPMRDGLHTLSGGAGFTLVDGRRRRFVAGAVSMRIGRLWNRPGDGYPVAVGSIEK